MNRRAFLLTPLAAVIPAPRDPYKDWTIGVAPIWRPRDGELALAMEILRHPPSNLRRMGKPIAGSLGHGYTQAMYDQNYGDWMAQP